VTAIYITDDGRLLAFDPADYRWVPKVEDLEAGVYGPRFEGEIKVDGSYEMRMAQAMMPLVKVRP
jgi:hypothetical protein